MIDTYKTYSPQNILFYTFSILLVASVLFAISLQNPVPLILPLIALVGFIAVINLNKLYAFFFLLLPFSLEVNLPGGFGTDLPSEPFMIGLTLIAIYLFAGNYHKIDARYIRHPITILLIIHIAWIGIATLFSENILVSTKFLLAKLWYVIPFYFLAAYLLRSKTDIRFLIKCLVSSLCLAIIFVIVSHAGDGFSFDRVNQAVSPVFRNHVNYACIVTLSLPYLWFLFKTSKQRFSRIIYFLLIIFFLSAIYLSYTRAAYVAVAIAIGAYYIIRWRLVKYILILATIFSIAFVGFLSYDNNYLDYKPEYEKAITHKKFDNLIEATSKLEDISTVERFYRWIAGSYMVADKPLLGFGPATFYFFYESYTVTGFQTYVSDNPEKSGIHNYYLMTAVEQGLIGLIIFVLFCFVVIIKGEQIYHKQQSQHGKVMVVATILSFIIICAILIINDMVEAAKVGPFFFFAPAILLIYDLGQDDERLSN